MLSLPARRDKKRMDYSAIPIARLASMALAPFAGNPALQSSQTLELTALSPLLMEEASVTQYGTRTSATERTLRVARNGELSGILNAKRASTTLDAAFVPLIAQQALLILVSHAKRIPMAEEQDTPWDALQDSRCLALSVILLAKKVTRVMAPFAGRNALLESTLAVLFAQTLKINAPIA